MFSKFSQSWTLFMETRDKRGKLKNDVWKLYLLNHEKTRTSCLNFGIDMKKEARRKCWTFGRFLGNWQPDLLGKIGSEPKVRKVFLESFLLISLRGLKTLLIHIKWAHNEGHLPSQQPIGSCQAEVEFGQETLSALRQRRPFLSMFRTFSRFSYLCKKCR